MTVSVFHSPDMPAASKISQRPYSWQEVRSIIQHNELEMFARSAETTEKYHNFKQRLHENHTTVFKHLVVSTLKWCTEEDVAQSADADIVVPDSGSDLLTNASDLKVVQNDFPYYFEDDVTHLCVWTKKRIESDPSSALGDLSPATRARIEKYVTKTFVDGLGVARENLVWFRNWEALQSVREVSHVHVVVKGMNAKQYESVVGGPGVPLTDADLASL